MNKPLWKIHEEHETTVRQVLKKDGCMDSLNRLRSWHGQRTLDALNAQGHSTVGFEACKCRKA